MVRGTGLALNMAEGGEPIVPPDGAWPAPPPWTPEQAAEAERIHNHVTVRKTLTATHREVSFTVGRLAGQGWPLADYLRALCPRYAPALIARWCDAGRLTVDGGPARADQPVRPGQKVHLLAALPPADPTYVAPPLAILHADDDLIVANKATGQLAHPAGRIMTGTLLNQLQDWVGARGGAVAEVRLVNRIDRDTSGIILASRHLAAHQALSSALAERDVHKEYRAICRGVPEPRQGEWNDPLGALGAHTVAHGVVPDGQPSRTAFRVEAEAPAGAFALLALVLHTGRQHQIRIHTSHHGHPLVGDWVYGEPVAELPGQALHSAVLEFSHPRDQRRVRLEAPLPPQLQALWDLVAAGGRPRPVPLNPEQRSRLGLTPGGGRREGGGGTAGAVRVCTPGGSPPTLAPPPSSPLPPPLRP